MRQEKILICDDEEGILIYLKKLLQTQGYQVETFNGGAALLRRLKEGDPSDADLLLQDVRMPDMDGITVLKEVKALRPSLPIVIMTAFGTIDAAVEAIKMGAYDYVTKPFPKEKILSVLKNALEKEQLLQENRALKSELEKPILQESIIFRSAAFQEIYDLTLQVAASEANILVLGESGTGKELIAGAIHYNSLRRDRRFLSINCAALTDTLLESQLFGHVRGAFTGAVAAQKGLLEEADGGTLFMDEIGDMTLPIQAKLLRVIQERDFIPVGSTRPKSADIRFVAATNKNLEQEVQEGRFREDLFYRLNVINIPLPPLRERKDDVEPLALHFLKKYSLKMKKQVTTLAPEALQLLYGYDWPGNIRELENVMERAVILARTQTVTAKELPIWRKQPQKVEAPRGEAQFVSLENVEKEAIERTLSGTGYHKSRSAEILGISRKTLDRKIVEYRITIPS
ncbi:sigma-54-dependent transcriptional response regulator [Citrifermentans bemidjiense Bem]|uniref:DNA-binding transcriptional regulator NtrC n=1 Tax=Citrifermentans bemidjiense (strain ATCC BAA-1014 / DSM 16622 / JCM 12645 / Bem) TaxID=404380 RepID=B5EED6_CITBB|nr:sigma-54 dependent transcriptional regulator [Citrifermentans bemidjiense]ACH39281.1 sigma-54-dependent transcriptional response regulator [Citrifermentans bemidjiense Bem]